MDEKKAHLEMIQTVTNRMSSNSFLIKGWSIVLVSAFFALAAGNSKSSIIYLAFFPAIAFWVLDGYFLWQERLFRGLFDHVRGLKNDEIDFSMDTSGSISRVKPWFNAIFSKTLLIFHGIILGSIVIVMLAMK